ncbi:hypothetical protein [Lentzea sp.]|uniref:hypothetical protein n=1 Tax=Lentzea sp. TaxID=56099 RepID=UPI002BC31293|nr:hypothetical protein [Lentzea sp.]HUQ57208.1 hypothetical protein [Lentzea sp.]
MSLDDAATVGAIIAPGIAEEGRAENWFRLISECYHDSVEDNDGQVPDWGTYWGSLSGKATDLGSAERDEFERYMRSVMAPMEIIGDLAGDSRGSAVSAVLSKYVENRQVEVAAGEEPFDEASWGAYLTKWAGGWDGTEATWPDFAQGIRYWAGEEPAGATELTRRVEELLAHAESQDITARTEFLTAYGIVASTGAATGQASEVDAQLVTALAETAATSEIVQTLFEETIVPGLTEAIEAVPGASELSIEEIQEILAEVLEEQLAAASGTAGA